MTSPLAWDHAWDFALVRTPVAPISALADVESSGEFTEQMGAAIALTLGEHALTGIQQDPEKRRSMTARMTTRVSPFGAFGGSAVVEVRDIDPTEVTLRLTVEAINTSLAPGAALELADAQVAARPEHERLVALNPSRYLRGDHWIFQVGPGIVAATARVRSTAAIDLVISTLADRRVHAGQLAREMAGDAAGEDRVESLIHFLGQLLGTGFLVDAPMILGAGRSIEDSLVETGADRDSVPRPTDLPLARRSVDVLDRQWDLFAQGFPEAAHISPEDRYYIDLRFCSEGAMAREATTALRRAALTIDHYLTNTVEPTHPDEITDVARFQQRFGESAVPLTELLDPDQGLLVEKRRFRSPAVSEAGVLPRRAPRRPAGQRLARFMPLADEVVVPQLIDGATTVELPPLDADEMLEREVPACRGFALAPTATESTIGLLNSYTFRSPAALIGRFTRHRPALLHRTRACVEALEAVYAARGELLVDVFAGASPIAANVVQRGALSANTIDLWSRSKGSIAAADVLVSVVQGAFCLTLRSTGQRIVPIIHTAHNYKMRENLPAYRFLGSLADRGGGAWSWAGMADLVRVLPEVRCGNVIVSPRTWQLTAEEVQHIARARSARASLLDTYPELEGLGWIGVSKGEFSHYADIASDDQVRSLLAESDDNGIRLHDAPEVARAGGVDEDGNARVTEVLLPGLSATRNRRPRSRIAVGHTPLREQPDSDWVYWKILVPPTSTDRLLLHLCDAVDLDSLPIRWFFLRFEERDQHQLRLRLERPAPALASSLEHSLRMARDDAIITDFGRDSYLPESNRHLGDSLRAHAERVFHWSSCRALEVIRNGLSSELRRHQTILDLERVIASFHSDFDARLEFLDGYRSGLPTVVDPKHKGFQNYWRSQRDELGRAELFGDVASDLSAVVAASAAAASEPPSRLDRYVSSICHMHVNRMIALEPPLEEALLLEQLRRLMLERHHKSQRAIPL